MAGATYGSGARAKKNTVTDSARRRLQNEDYINYLHSCNAIQVFCECSLKFADKVVRTYHTESQQDNECMNHVRRCITARGGTPEELLAPLCDKCKDWLNDLKDKRHYKDSKLNLKNVNIHETRKDPWAMAKLFMQNYSKAGKQDVKKKSSLEPAESLNPGDFDTSSILQLMINFCAFHVTEVRHSNNEFRDVLKARNTLMHLEVRRGMKITTDEKEKYLDRVNNLVDYIETNVEHDPEVFNCDVVHKEIRRLNSAIVDELVPVEDNVIQGTIAEFDIGIGHIKIEFKETGGTNPVTANDVIKEVEVLSNFVKENSDLYTKFRDDVIKLNTGVREVKTFMRPTPPQGLDQLLSDQLRTDPVNETMFTCPHGKKVHVAVLESWCTCCDRCPKAAKPDGEDRKSQSLSSLLKFPNW